MDRTNVHVISDRGHQHDCPCRNEQLFVNLSRNTNNGLREGQDVILVGCTNDIGSNRVESEDFLRRAGDQLLSTDRHSTL